MRDTLRAVYATNDEKEVAKAVEQMRAIPNRNHDSQWQLEAEFLKLNFFHDYRSGDDEKFVDDLLKMKKKARKAGNDVFVIRITRRLMDFYVEKSDPVNEARYACMLERESRDITEDQFPDIIDNAYRLASLFMRFHSYEKAMPYLKQVLSHEVVPEIQLIFLDARNDMGNILRESDLEASDSLFLTLITDTTITDKEYWYARGIANLGTNAFVAGNYERSIRQLSEGYRILESHGEWPVCLNVASGICRSYCRTGNMKAAAKWYGKVMELGGRLTDEESAFHREMYSSQAEYEALRGNYLLSGESRDRCIDAVQRHYYKWSPSIITDVESILSYEELREEKHKSDIKLMTIFLLAYFILMMTVVAAYLMVLNRRKRQMIEALSIQARVWAMDKGSCDPGGQRHIDLILQYLESSKIYLNNDCTLESIAKATLLNRSYVSKAVNENYKNFNWMLNSFRIREALKMLESDNKIRVEELREACGFGSTSSFYEAFKSITGMSVKEYRATFKEKNPRG